MVELNMTKDNFHLHMKVKAQEWKVPKLKMGEDFAVFTFYNKYQSKKEAKKFKKYNEFYGYEFSRQGKEMCIVNACPKEATKCQEK